MLPLLLAALCYLPTTTATPAPITFGFSGSLSGHFGTYGTMITRGILAAFNAKNATGGVDGHPLTLICKDDRGNAQQTVANITALRNAGTSWFLGVMSSHSMRKTVEQIKQLDIAMLFPWGATPELHNPTARGYIGGLGNIQAQINTLLNEIVHVQKIKRLGLFHADDTFSTQAAGYCTKSLLSTYNTTPVASTVYNRYTLDIPHSTQTFMAADPRVIICLGTSMPTVTLINQLFERKFYGVRLFGTDATFLVPQILQSKGVNFTYASPVPDPVTSGIKLATDYRRDLTNFFPDEPHNILSFSFYIAARLVIQALEKTSTQKTIATTTALITQLEQFKNVDFHGFPVNFNPQNRYLFGERTWLITPAQA